MVLLFSLILYPNNYVHPPPIPLLPPINSYPISLNFKFIEGVKCEDVAEDQLR
jgi:hypothetical protein